MLKNGFSLTELLIALAIIGIIASLTIPNVIHDVQTNETKIRLKKAYVELQEVTKKVIWENNGTLEGTFPGDKAGSQLLADAYSEHLNYIKKCEADATMGGTGNGGSVDGCWHKANEWKALDDSTIGAYNEASFILNDGSLIDFYLYKTACDHLFGDYNRCGYVTIDVNGFKEPNTIGKDIFWFSITKNNLIPYGINGFYTIDNDCDLTKAPASTDRACTAKILAE